MRCPPSRSGLGEPNRQAGMPDLPQEPGPFAWRTPRCEPTTMSAPKSSDKTPRDREDWGFEELQAQADDLRKKLNAFRKSLGRFFVQKQDLIDLMIVAAVAQEPLLLVGPPGTAKSDLVLKFKD